MSVFGELIIAMITPFTEEGEVDYGETASITRYLIEEQSCDALLVAGTTGESATLSKDEKIRLFREVKEASQKQCLVLGGTGTNNTRETVRLCQEAERVGLDGIMVITPYYNCPPENGLVAHFSQVSNAVSLPVMIYNVPSRTACDMSASLLKELFSLPAIQGLKEAGGDFFKVGKLCYEHRDDIGIYSGNDATTLPFLSLGAHGVVSVAAHIMGKTIKTMIKAFQQGNLKKARTLHGEMLDAFQALFVTTNPIPIKKAMEWKGFSPGPCRLPLGPLKEEQEEYLLQILQFSNYL